MIISKRGVFIILSAVFFINIPGDNTTAFATEKLNIELLGTYNAGGFFKESLDISSDTVYFTEGFGLRIIDFSNSNSPELLGTFGCRGTIGGVAQEGNYVYLSDSSGYFTIVNISDPTKPAESGSFDTGSDGWWDMVVDGDYVYQDGGGVLRIINVANPSMPFEASTIAMNVISLDVSGNYVYVGTGNSLEVVDVSNPSSPNKIGHFDLNGYCWNLVINDNLLYLIDGTTGVRIIDISNPVTPAEIKSYEISGLKRGIDFCNNYLYVGGDSLRVLNISDLENIYLTGYYKTSVNDLKISNNCCYTIPGIKKVEYTPPFFSDGNAVSVGQILNFNENGQGDGHEINMMFSSATGNGNIVVDQFNSKYPDIPNSNSLNCFWDINLSSNVSDFLSNLTFHYADDDVLGYSESAAFLGVAKFNKNQFTWEWLGGDLDAENNRINVDDIDSFSSFVLFRRIFGDVTGDGYVELADLQRLGDVWGQTHSTEFSEGSDARFFNYNKSSGLLSQKIDENDLEVFYSCWHNGIAPNIPGQNSTAGIRIDFSYQISGNQNQSSIAPPGSNVDVYLEVHVTLAPNLDTYEFELNYSSSDLTFESASEDNSLSGEKNFLKKNGGATMGWLVSDFGTHLTIRNSLVGDQGWDTPDGDGLLALIKFKTKVDAPAKLVFGNFNWYDKDRVHYIGTDKGQGSLPVELSSFNASLLNKNVILKWLTKAETNNYGFDIEKMNQSGQWLKIGFISGSGTTNHEQFYSFTDNDVLVGNNSYRLKQVDLDGKINYSNVINIFFELPRVFKISQNYPNPFNPNTHINYQIPTDSHVTIKIYNTKGQEIRTLVNENKSTGYYTVEWDGKDDHGNLMVSGIFFYSIHAGEYKETKKMAILK